MPRTAMLASVSTLALALALVGAPVAVRNPGSDITDRSAGTDPLAVAGAAQWRSEPSAAALLAAGTKAGRAEQFYFVLPDRFANGDPRNDAGGLAGDRLSTGLDPKDKGFYHGGDLKGVMDRLDYVQGLGTTAIWLAPVFKNRPVQGSGADVSAGYHGYWITDFTQVDPHFGTNADLKKLVRQAHQRGIKVYLDVIVNHTADVIRYAENTYTYVDKKTSPYTDAQGRPFEDRNYADGNRDFPEVDAEPFPYTPTFATPADAKAKVPAWLNDPTMYHNRGDSTFAGENSEYGDFFGLDDLWTERPEVVRGMTKIYGDWIADTGVDGFRLDTVEHANLEFWPQFSQGIARAAEKAGNSGDWFNQIRWDCAQGNGFGAGLPPAADNQDKWPYAKPLLADPKLVPDCAAIDLAGARYAEMLRIRRSSPVFGLTTAEQVQQRVAFPLSGAAETPGVLTMTVDARGLDGKWKSLTVVFNATPQAATQQVPGLRGADVALHPVLRDSADPVLRTASFDRASGTFTVPGRSVAVFVQS
ncbi:alpha-1,6-glucosidase domain-containing protein [Micromonospora olivasterospora]